MFGTISQNESIEVGHIIDSLKVCQHSLSIQGLCAAAADVVTAVTEGGATNFARSTLCIWLACCVMTCLIMWIRRRKRDVQMSHATSWSLS